MTDSIPNARPFDLLDEEIRRLFAEAEKLAGKDIETPEQAEAVQVLLRQIQQVETDTDTERKKEAKPFDDGKKEVQDRYNVLIAPLSNKTPGLTAKAVQALKNTLLPYQRKLQAEQEAIAAAARADAERVAAVAAEAMRAAHGSASLQERQRAEEMVEDAKNAEKLAREAEKARPQVSGEGRAATLRVSYKPVLTNLNQACRAFFVDHAAEFEAVCQKIAEAQVAAGKRQLEGFDVIKVETVV